MTRSLALVSLAFLAMRVATAALLTQPGYTDSYYFTNVAVNLASGHGLVANFLWSPVEARDIASFALPVPSHLFWVPLPTTLAALGIALLSHALGVFRAAQLPFLVLSAFIPPAAFAAARSLGASDRASLMAATIAGLGAILAPFVVAVDAIVPAMLMGTAFFMTFARAARGSVAAGLITGILVGVLFLARSEAALFGLALLALAMVPRARVAGLAGAAVALLIGGVWFARDLPLGATADVFARSALLDRYEDFFAFVPHYSTGTGSFFSARLAALPTNAVTFVFVFGLVPVVGLAAGVRALWSRADVRAWAVLAFALYLAQSLIWTLHSTRGSYLHSLAAFFPFGIAIAAVGAERLLASRKPELALWTWVTLAIVALISGGAVLQIDGGLAATAADRDAALDAIPPGPFLAIDAAAWRWISGREVAVTPSDGETYAACTAAAIDARSIVLESAHFSRYDDLYSGRDRWAWLGEPVVRGSIKVFPIRGDIGCSFTR